MSESPPVAIVLPPSEGFGPYETGAVGQVVHHHAAMADRPVVVVGPEQSNVTYAGIDYRAASPSWLDGYAGGVARVLKQVRPALIEVHNRPEVALALAAAFRRTPVALFLHNDPRRMRGVEKGFSRLAAVVCVSSFIAGRLGDIRPRPVVLPNPIDFADVPHSAADPPSTRANIILFAGRVVPEKGADLFIAAWAAAEELMQGWRAVIIGADRFSDDSPETPYIAALRPQAKAANVEMLGYRPHEAVLTALSETSIAVVPSRWQEPFGLVALEAMACGAALIASPEGGLPEVIGDGGLMIHPESGTSFANAITTLGTDGGFRDAMARRGRARAKQFGTDAIGPRLAAHRARWIAEWPRER